MDEGHAGFLLQFHRPVVGVVVGALDQTDLGAQTLGALHLHDGGAVRHADHAAQPHPGGGQCHALGMVAGAAGDDALGTFLRGKLADLVVSAPYLETAGDLQILGLEVELAGVAQPGGGNQVGAAGHVFQDEGGVIDLVQCQHEKPPVAAWGGR